MTVLSRYLLRQLSPRVAAALGLGVLLLLAADVVQQGAQIASQAGLPVIGFYLLRLPLMAIEVLPLAALLGVTWGLRVLALRGETEALRTSGVRAGALFRPTAALGVLLAGLAHGCAELLVPAAEHEAAAIARSVVGLPEAEHPAAAIIGNQLVFEDGSGYALAPGSLPTPIAGAPSPPPPVAHPESLSTRDLGAAIDRLRTAGIGTSYEETLLRAKIVHPFACLLGALMGLLIGWRFSKWSVAVTVSTAVAWTALVVVLGALSSAGLLSPLVGTIGPHAIVAATLGLAQQGLSMRG